MGSGEGMTMDAPFESSRPRRRFAQPAPAQFGCRSVRRLSRRAVLRHRHRQDGRACAAAAAMTAVPPNPKPDPARRNRRVAAIARGDRCGDGRRRLRRGPALRRVLQGDRLRRHDAGRARRAGGARRAHAQRQLRRQCRAGARLDLRARDADGRFAHRRDRDRLFSRPQSQPRAKPPRSRFST